MTDTLGNDRSFNRRDLLPGRNLYPAFSDLANGMSEEQAISPADILELTDHMNITLDKMAELIRRMENCIEGTRLLHENGMPHADDVSTHMKVAVTSVRTLALEMNDIAGAATVVSTQMLSQMGRSLQKSVAQLAVAHATQAEPSGEKPVGDSS